MTDQLEVPAAVDSGARNNPPASPSVPAQPVRRPATTVRPPTAIIASVALTVLTAALLMAYLGSDGVYLGLLVAVASLLVAVGVLERQRVALYGVLVLAALSVLSAVFSLLDAPVTSALRALAGAGVATLLLVPQESRDWFAPVDESTG
ncbi:MAG TPA: hypothetical protein VF054_11585 [Micromonosporaceae bacterium]